MSGLIALAALLVFANCLLNAFVWDDEQFIVKNAFLGSPRFLLKLLTENVVSGAGLVSNLYRPFQSLTHFFDVQLWGSRAWGHHLTTVLLHAAASVAVFRLLARLFAPWPAALAALLFSLHPLQSEAVAYTCGRGDTLAILFLCLGLLAFRARRGLSLACAALSVASKEHGVLFPAFLFLYDRALGRPAPFRRHLPFWLLSAGYIAARLTVLNFKDTLNFYGQPNLLTEHVSVRLYTYLTTLAKGLLLWVWPADLHHERSWPVFTSLAIPQVWLSLLLVAALLGWSLRLRARSRPAAIGLWWFVIATLPTSNLIVLINAVFYDHWFILPGLGLAMAAGQALERAFARGGRVRGAAAAFSVGAVVACAMLTVRANGVWRDPISLYTHILFWEPRSAKIHNNLAMAYNEAGREQEAIALYQRAIALSDAYPQTHHNLANAYLRRGDEDRALEEFGRAVAMDPHFHHSWLQIGAIRLKAGQPAASAEAFARAVHAYPYAAEAYLGLAEAYRAQGKPDAARTVLAWGRAALPDHPALQAP
ncbi:MAG: tetratricopeptide repeat protein [Candidatus Omnitrophica bacterium]|nr:tetratricopeptide repeat protein [Candidatus Omnitrophota bacterium]